jgi:hypothetical protein
LRAAYIVVILLRNSLIDALHPAMGVCRNSALNIYKFCPNFLSHLPRTACADDKAALCGLHFSDRRDDSSGAAGECLNQSA